MMDYEYFIFDLDGTLIDSTPCHVRAFNFAISNSSLAGKIDFNYEEMKGKRTIDVMTELGFQFNEAERLTKVKQEKYREFVQNGEVDLFDDVIESFRFLKNRSKKVYICTGASRSSVEIILKKFNMAEYIDDFITGSDVEKAKPAPDILNNLIETNNLEKAKCLFVEDSENGKVCGELAGVKTVMVNNSDFIDKGGFENYSLFFQNLQGGV